jgi:hypothetical protein
VSPSNLQEVGISAETNYNRRLPRSAEQLDRKTSDRLGILLIATIRDVEHVWMIHDDLRQRQRIARIDHGPHKIRRFYPDCARSPGDRARLRLVEIPRHRPNQNRR